MCRWNDLEREKRKSEQPIESSLVTLAQNKFTGPYLLFFPGRVPVAAWPLGEEGGAVGRELAVLCA